MDNKKIYSSKGELLAFLNIKENFLYSNFSEKYSEKIIPKRNGGIRKIEPPNSKLKKIQRAVLDKILCFSPQLPCVYGLSKDKGLLANAKTHQKNASSQLLILDIENFFPSIERKQVIRVFKKLGFNHENSLVLTKICTVGKKLPQGAPTSPYLASLVCISLDKEIYLYCKKRRLEYTRYFDDISVSGKNIRDKNISQIEGIINKHSFKSNEEKRELHDSTSINKVINGVLIMPTGLSVTTSYKKDIHDVYQNWRKDQSIKNERVFAGKLGFYLHINKEEAISFKNELEKISV